MQPIIRKSLATEVVEILKNKIRNCEIEVGSKLLSEPELMQSFQVGRSTIREAVKQLEQSGFVEVRQGKGTLVTSRFGNRSWEEAVKISTFSDVFEVRRLLEFRIVEKAAKNRSAEHLDSMKKYLESRKHFATEGMMKECIDADLRFHICMAESCGNEILLELYKTLSVHISKFFLADYTDTHTPLESQELHEELLTSIEEKNSELAISLTKRLIGV